MRIALLAASFLLLLASTSYKYRPATTFPATPDTLVFIMVGQSNMAGRGTVAPEDTVRILEMDDDFRYFPKQEPNKWHQGWPAGLDCGKSFGAEMLRHLMAQTTFALIQCSISNTRMEEWLNDTARACTSTAPCWNAYRPGGAAAASAACCGCRARVMPMIPFAPSVMMQAFNA